MVKTKIRGKLGSFQENTTITAWVEENTGVHPCGCGCGDPVPVTRAHHRLGIPKFKQGHNGRADRKGTADRTRAFFQTDAGKKRAKAHSKFMKKYLKENGSPSEGRIMSQEAKNHQSAVLKAKYASGEIKPWNKGTTGQYTDETRRRMSISSKNRFRIKENHPRFGTHHTEESKRKMSENRKGVPSWNAGKTGVYTDDARRKMSLSHGGTGVPYEHKEYGPGFTEALKEAVRSRDNHMCDVCGKFEVDNGQKLDVHHIDYDKHNNVIENLVALCKPCHVRTLFDRNRWTAFFMEGLK